jgi:two-component system nitrogen regulation sensor histidine kinase NtrY
MILLATVLMLSLLAFAAAVLARTVARPVKELVGATARIANGDYATRLVERTEDEIAELVRGFNSMASSLAHQRSDLERRRDYMEALLRHATTGVISTDPQGRIVTLNPATRALLSPRAQGLREGESLGEALAGATELTPLSDALDAAAARSGEPTEVDVELAGKPRRFRVVRIELPDPSGGSVGSLILLDDVTELMRSNQLAAWAEMARAIAHEIKNPLTPIQLSTEHVRRLLSDRGVLPSAEIDACLDTVIKQVRTLYGIAGEFSTYARLPDLQPEPLDAVEFMRSTIGPYRASGLGRVELVEHYEPAGTVAVDPKVLGRAVVNLVENALEAMPDGGRLTIAVGPANELGEVSFAVSDTGIGIDSEARRRLFEPYFSTKSSGTGLGLAIVRRAVEAHDGQIEIKTDDDGTTFEIRLPPASRILDP